MPKLVSRGGLGLIGIAALVSWACSRDLDDAGPTGNAAGQEATSGAAGQPEGGSGSEMSPGSAGAGASGGRADDGCELRSVIEYCAEQESRLIPQPCPTGPNDFDFKCGPYSGVNRYATDCGGVVIEVWGDKMNGFDYYSTDFSFNARGDLIGIGLATDYVNECPSVWGTPCAHTGEPESLCGSGGAGGQGGAGGAGGVGGQGRVSVQDVP